MSAGGDYSFPMLWEDGSFTSWEAFGITSQPAAVLLSADGAQMGQWSGAFSEDQVLDLIENPPAS